MVVFNMKRVVTSKHKKPFDLNQKLDDAAYAGYYRTTDGDIIEVHDYEGFDYDEENFGYRGDEEPEGEPVVGGVYWDDVYEEGGLMTYTKDETLRDFNDSGFISGLAELIVAPGEKGYGEFDDIFYDYDLDPEEKKRRLEDLIRRLGLGRGRATR